MHMIIYYLYKKLVAISRMENQCNGQNTIEKICLSRSCGFSLLTPMNCSFIVAKALKIIDSMSYMQQAWSRTTQISSVSKKISYRACSTCRETTATEMRIVIVVSVTTCKYCGWMTQ